MTEAAYQKCVLLSVCFLVGVGMWMGRAWLRGPEGLEEKDRALALRDTRRRRSGDSLLLKRLKAIKRRGDQLTKVYNGARK